MSEKVESILEANALYHVYDSKAEDGNVVALRGLHVKVNRVKPWQLLVPRFRKKSTYSSVCVD